MKLAGYVGGGLSGSAATAAAPLLCRTAICCLPPHHDWCPPLILAAQHAQAALYRDCKCRHHGRERTPRIRTFPSKTLPVHPQTKVAQPTKAGSPQGRCLCDGAWVPGAIWQRLIALPANMSASGGIRTSRSSGRASMCKSGAGGPPARTGRRPRDASSKVIVGRWKRSGLCSCLNPPLTSLQQAVGLLPAPD